MEKLGSEPEVFGIVDKLSTSYGNTMAGVAIPGSSKIALHPFRPITSSSRDVPLKNDSNGPANIYVLKPNSIFENSILRGLVAESNSIFVALQSLADQEAKAEYATISCSYRSIIRAYIEKLQNAKEKEVEESANDESDFKSYPQYISILYSTECIWHICEIVFLDVTQTNVIAQRLLEWIRFYFPKNESSATELMVLNHEAVKNEDYWPTITGLVMQGQISIAHGLLQLHPSVESAAFKMAIQILEAMPPYSYSSVPVEKFQTKFEYWKADTELKLSANILSVEPDLEKIIKLALGDTQSWNTEIKKSECWYQHFPSYLYFTNPTCKLFELGKAANDWLVRWATLKGVSGETLQLRFLDQVILHVMENDLKQVIHHIEMHGDNQWFVTHMTDLLYNSGQLRLMGEQPEDCVELRNSMIFEYGSNLMTCNNLWQFGIDYLEQCSEEGEGAIKIMLPRLPIHTEKMALRIISIARRKGFTDAEQEICKIMSRRSLDTKSYMNALEWAIRSKDTILVSSIADVLLKHYVKTGEMLCTDIISKLGEKMLISPRLVILCKYFDFYNSYRMSEFVHATETLMVLLQSESLPEYFWPTILVDALPLLESKDPKLNTKETCIILTKMNFPLRRLIEKIEKRSKNQTDSSVEIIKDYRIENMNEMVNRLRLACLKNYARGVITEGTSK